MVTHNSGNLHSRHRVIQNNHDLPLLHILHYDVHYVCAIIIIIYQKKVKKKTNNNKNNEIKSHVLVGAPTIRVGTNTRKPQKQQ